MIHTGDCIEVMAGMPADSVDAVVTDPPYGIRFMGKAWDGADIEKAIGEYQRTWETRDKPLRKDNGRAHSTPIGSAAAAAGVYDLSPKAVLRFQAWCEAWGREALRVTKPGGYLLAFGGGRTHHRLTCGLEDAGWVIRETLVWVYASGFAKSRNVSRDLEQAVPEGARCVCVPHSTRTVLDSQDGYRPERGSDGGPPRPAEGTGRAAAPLRGGVRGRSRGGPSVDDPVLGLAHSPDPVSTARPSTVHSQRPASRQSEGSRFSDTGPSDKPSSTSDSQDGSAADRNRRRTPSTRRLDGDSVSAWSPPRGDAFPYSKCTSCGGWQTAKGWGTALKPAAEYIVMARKPLTGNVAANVAQYGTGAINVDGTRIGIDATDDIHAKNPHTDNQGRDGGWVTSGSDGARYAVPQGRWPSSVLLSDPALFDEPNPYVVGSGAVSQNQETRTDPMSKGVGETFGGGARRTTQTPEYLGDTGGYSRFFIVPKADRSDREPVVRGQLDGEPQRWGGTIQDGRPHMAEGYEYKPKARENGHPTVKPTDLMRHLVRLITPSGGTVLDPFLGSGSTAIACELEGFPWIGIEQDASYVAIAEARLNGTQRGLGLDVAAPTKARTATDVGMNRLRQSIKKKGRKPHDDAGRTTYLQSGFHRGTSPDEEPAA